MKTTTAFYLLIFYTFALCKPVLPLVKDEIAHLFWKADHIATVHHHHGDHHAEEEIAEAAHEEERAEHPTTTKTPEPVSVHLIVQSIFNVLHVDIEKQQFPVKSVTLVTMPKNKHYPPPKSC